MDEIYDSSEDYTRNILYYIKWRFNDYICHLSFSKLQVSSLAMKADTLVTLNSKITTTTTAIIIIIYGR